MSMLIYIVKPLVSEYILHGDDYMSEKIVVRKKIYKSGELNNKLVLLTTNLVNETLLELKSIYDDYYIMMNLFDEVIDNKFLESSTIYKKYIEITRSGEENEYFIVMNKVKPELAVYVNNHIKLYHIYDDLLIGNEKIVPWDYVYNEVDIADSWWFSENEVLNDMVILNFIEFAVKYKIC